MRPFKNYRARYVFEKSSMKNVLLFYCAIFPLLGHAEDALQACQKALSAGDYAQAAKTGKQAGGFNGAMCLGRALQASGDHAGAAAAFAEAEHNAHEPFDRMLAITFLARTSQAAGKVDEAFSHYERSLKIAREQGQKQALMITLNESGQLLQARGDFRAALGHFKEAYSLAANGNERSECNQLIAAAYNQLGDHDKAIEHQLKSVILEESNGDFDHYLNARLELAAIATTAKDYPRAQKELEGSLKQAQSAGSEYWQAKAMLYQGRLERVRGAAGQAQVLFKTALDLANKIGAETLSRQISAELKQQ
ncbi:MAG: hypothetical protein A3B82_06040 [Methylophilales bacterium RIFCSPHIGHO2_02_FULL_57_10]|nr:MAG: hypothetical protein A3B82_06040 [Methylophilales bacterium RIFCSPHIGHO2_02_FULL_57_10]